MESVGKSKRLPLCLGRLRWRRRKFDYAHANDRGKDKEQLEDLRKQERTTEHELEVLVRALTVAAVDPAVALSGPMPPAVLVSSVSTRQQIADTYGVSSAEGGPGVEPQQLGDPEGSGAATATVLRED